VFAPDFVVGLVDGSGFLVDFVADLTGLETTEGSEGTKDWAYCSSKGTLGFLDRFDLRSVGSAMIIKLNSLNLMNSSSLWVSQAKVKDFENWKRQLALRY
jgi:hypothetical protein